MHIFEKKSSEFIGSSKIVMFAQSLTADQSYATTNE
jgi:hypothetical protein